MTHLDFFNFPVGFKVFANVFLRQVGRDAAHENLSDALTRRRLHDQESEKTHETTVIAGTSWESSNIH